MSKTFNVSYVTMDKGLMTSGTCMVEFLSSAKEMVVFNSEARQLDHRPPRPVNQGHWEDHPILGRL